MPPRTTEGYPFLYVLSTMLFLLAVSGLVLLLSSDIAHRYAVSAFHQRLDALPLGAIGLSYIAAHLTPTKDRVSQIRAVFLGVAFLLWAGADILPPSRPAVIMDEGAVAIFVLDVSSIIWDKISLKDRNVQAGPNGFMPDNGA